MEDDNDKDENEDVERVDDGIDDNDVDDNDVKDVDEDVERVDDDDNDKDENEDVEPRDEVPPCVGVNITTTHKYMLVRFMITLLFPKILSYKECMD